MTYKFKAINTYLLESLEQSELYVPPLCKLNDPFDCQLNVDYLFEETINLARLRNNDFIKYMLLDKNFKDEWKREVSEIGVYSVSISEAILNEHLMWAHYAENHSGVCIKYNENFTKFVKTIIADQSDGGRVTYTETSDFAARILELPQKQPYFTKGLNRIYLFTKNKSWQYEDEGRFIVNRAKLNSESKLQLPANYIHSIYFGINVSDEGKRSVISLAQRHAGCNYFYQAHRCGYYGIEFKETA
jgi:hypothetical protein